MDSAKLRGPEATAVVSRVGLDIAEGVDVGIADPLRRLGVVGRQPRKLEVAKGGLGIGKAFGRCLQSETVPKAATVLGKNYPLTIAQGGVMAVGETEGQILGGDLELADRVAV